MAIFWYYQLEGQFPNPKAPEASVNWPNLGEFSHVSSRKKDFPLKLDKKDNHKFKSSLTSLLSLI